MRFEAHATGIDSTRAMLARLGQRADDVRPAWPAVERVLAGREKAWFATKGGGTWPKLADSTRARDARGHRDPRLMRASGALERSLTVPGSAGAVRTRRPTELSYGTSLFYASFQDKRRPLIDADRATRALVARELASYIARGR